MKLFTLPSNSKRIFSPSLEVLNISTGLAVLALAVLELIFNRPIPKESHQATKFITSSIFLNSIHIYFTFGMLLFLPNLQNWRKNRRDKLGHWTWIVPASIFVVTAFLSAVSSSVFGEWTSIAFLFWILVGIVPPHHILSQMRGLSYMYYNDKQSWRFAWEQKLAFAFSITYLAWVFTGVFKIWPGPMVSVIHSAFTAIAIAIIMISLSSVKQLGWNKFLYCLRFLAFPLIPFSTTAMYGLGVMHGVEYYCVFKHMSGNAKLDHSRNKLLIASVMTMSFIGLILLFCRYGDGAWTLLWDTYRETPVGVKILGSTLWGLTFLHYYYDRILFRMRKDESRTHVLPLLRGSSLNTPREFERLNA